MKPPALLPREFYARDPLLVARELIGKSFVRRTAQGLCGGTIVETEAYLASGDPASHSFRGKTRKNATMFGRPGLLYVYPIHGRFCLNAVTESRGIASAVLIRALIPQWGVEWMQRRRRHCSIQDLLRGPARLCEALNVDRRLDGWDLTRGQRIWIEEPASSEATSIELATSRRIGVTSGHDFEYRFFARDCRFVSGARQGIHSANTRRVT